MTGTATPGILRDHWPVLQGHEDAPGECTRCPAHVTRRFVWRQGALVHRLCWECDAWLRMAYGIGGR